jgi:hypothetical protein
MFQCEFKLGVGYLTFSLSWSVRHKIDNELGIEQVASLNLYPYFKYRDRLLYSPLSQVSHHTADGGKDDPTNTTSTAA